MAFLCRLVCGVDESTGLGAHLANEQRLTCVGTGVEQRFWKARRESTFFGVEAKCG